MRIVTDNCLPPIEEIRQRSETQTVIGGTLFAPIIIEEMDCFMKQNRD